MENKTLKLISGTGSLNIEGEIHFDNARTETFDFSDYKSTGQQALKFIGKLQNLDLVDYQGDVSFCGREAIVVNKKLCITKPYYGYKNYSITNKDYIIPTASNVVLSGTGTANLKFNNNDYSVNGLFTVYNNSANISTINFINSSGTVVSSYNSLVGGESFVINANNLVSSTTTQINAFKHDTSKQIEIP